MIYLDEAATTPVRRDVLEAMWPYLTAEYGNPSSHHSVGESARRALEEARSFVASSLGARPGEIIFTSGGTEADNAAIKGIAFAAPRGRHVVVSAVEHQAVLESALFLERLGFELTVLDVDREGTIRPETLAAVLREDTTLVSIQYANNEVGTVQPIAELSALAAELSVPFHTDAVQAAATQDLHMGSLGADALSLSGHKLGAPKGVGALFLKRGTPFEPLVHGGGQENERRSGTENVAGAVGLAAALAARRADSDFLRERRDAFITRILAEVEGSVLTGPREHRLPGNASFVFPGTSGESILLELEARGIICSSGSACSAGSDEPSHVLTAMGYEREIAQTAVRFSFGASTTTGTLDEVVAVLADAVGRVRSLTTGSGDYS